MSHSLIRGISGLEGSSDGVLLLPQGMVLVLCPGGQIEIIWQLLELRQEDQSSQQSSCGFGIFFPH